jgi:hypothetical protein
MEEVHKFNEPEYIYHRQNPSDSKRITFKLALDLIECNHREMELQKFQMPVNQNCDPQLLWLLEMYRFVTTVCYSSQTKTVIPNYFDYLRCIGLWRWYITRHKPKLWSPTTLTTWDV